MTEFRVETDARSLITTIECSNPEDRAYKTVRFSYSSLAPDIDRTPNGFRIPWTSFREGLHAFGNIVKESQSSLVFSDFDKQLIKRFLDDIDEARIEKPKPTEPLGTLELTLSDIGFKRSLTKEQSRDLYKLISLKHGANFSVPGAGKTTTLLALHSILKLREEVDRLFVVAPLNAFISWEDEILEIFGVGALNVLRMTSSDVRAGLNQDNLDRDIYLVNYEKLRGNVRKLFPFFLVNKVHLVLDESHRIKGGKKNLSYRQIVKLGELSARRDIMSGTPMPQSYVDLDSQFKYLWRTNLIPEDIGSKNDLGALQRLSNLLAPKFVRTTKTELGLKDPEITYSTVLMGPVQSEFYRLFRSEVARHISGMDRDSRKFYRGIGRCTVRLLQAATNPMLLGTNDEYLDDPTPIPPGSRLWELLNEYTKYEKSTKIEYLRSRLSNILSDDFENKVVVWSYFVRNIKLLEHLFSEFNPVSIYGDIPTGDTDDERYREARIRKFHQDPECRILIANPQACGEGISLHKASHHAIYLDRNFNAAYYLQSLDRIHRLGLAKSVSTHVEILISANTIDEILVDRLNQKIKAMGKVLDDPGLVRLVYDPSDIPEEDQDGLDSTDIELITDHLLHNNDKA